MPHTESNTATFVASEIIPANRLVKLDAAGTVSIADITTTPIGRSPNTQTPSGEELSVRMLNRGGIIDLVADAAVTRGAVVYGQNDGKIDDDSSGSAVRIGLANETATADGDEIEVILD